jgi:outer membrane protein assembly factor BamB
MIFVAGWTPGSGVSRMPSFDSLLAQADANHDGKLTRSEAPPGPANRHFLYIDANKDGFVTRAEYEAIANVFDRSRNVALAIRPEGKGDVTDTHVVWQYTRGLPYCSSPLFYDNKIFLVKNGGIATCLDAKTGTPFYSEERIGALGDYYSSPVAAGGRICVISHPGVAVIIRAGEQLEVLARNPLGEQVVATPAIVDGKLYVRGREHLFAFGNGRTNSASP